MTVDVSEGIGLDYSVISVIDVTRVPYDQVAMIRSNVIIPTMFSDLVFRVATMYNDAVVIVETNSVGQQIVNDLWEFEYENMLMTQETPKGAQVKESGRKASSRNSNDCEDEIDRLCEPQSADRIEPVADPRLRNDHGTVELRQKEKVVRS